MKTDQTDIKHHIQKHILSVLLRQRTARFSQMRPPRTDTNLYSYHLTQLVKSGLVEKVEGGYSLGTEGLVYTDRLNADKMFVRQQPKIVTMLVIQNGDGDTLLQRRTKQPYIDMWTLPNGKMHIDDPSLLAAAQREASEKLGLHDQEMTHAGDCYIRVHVSNSRKIPVVPDPSRPARNHFSSVDVSTDMPLSDKIITDSVGFDPGPNEVLHKSDGDTIMTVTLVHVFRMYRDDIETDENTVWVQPHKLDKMELAPGVSEIIARTFFRDPFFFEEFNSDW